MQRTTPHSSRPPPQTPTTLYSHRASHTLTPATSLTHHKPFHHLQQLNSDLLRLQSITSIANNLIYNLEVSHIPASRLVQSCIHLAEVSNRFENDVRERYLRAAREYFSVVPPPTDSHSSRGRRNAIVEQSHNNFYNSTTTRASSSPPTTISASASASHNLTPSSSSSPPSNPQLHLPTPTTTLPSLPPSAILLPKNRTSKKHDISQDTVSSSKNTRMQARRNRKKLERVYTQMPVIRKDKDDDSPPKSALNDGDQGAFRGHWVCCQEGCGCENEMNVYLCKGKGSCRHERCGGCRVVVPEKRDGKKGGEKKD